MSGFRASPSDAGPFEKEGLAVIWRKVSASNAMESGFGLSDSYAIQPPALARHEDASHIKVVVITCRSLPAVFADSTCLVTGFGDSGFP